MKKNSIITGATSGIGFQTALQLADLGHRILITGRNRQAAETAVQAIQSKTSNTSVDFLLADLSTRSGMEHLLAGIKKQVDQIDVFINNVGGLFAERQQTADGLERHLAVNHIIPAMLLDQLKPLFRKQSDSRFVFLTTSGHRFGKPDFKDVQSEKKFYGLSVYNKSKSYNLLYNFSKAEAFRREGILIIAADPGGAKTSMTNQLDARFVPPILKPVMGLMKMTGAFGNTAKAATSAVFAATSPELIGKPGSYVSPGPKIGKAAGYVYKAAYQQQSLHLTETMLQNL